MNMKRILTIIPLIFLLNTVLIAAYNKPVWSKNGMVAAPHHEATLAAISILDKGGNAVDAIVAASFALAVVEPYHSGLGGGEFTLLKMQDGSEVIACDARECAPGNASKDMYINPKTGEVNNKLSWRGGLAVGVPGSVAGKARLVEKYGNLQFNDITLPAYLLAKNGFKIDRVLASSLRSKSEMFAEKEATSKVFLKNGLPLKRGEILIQQQLAKTLLQIGKDNGNSFYQGKIAEAIVESCQEHNGILTLEDLSSYKVIFRKPPRFTYRDYEIYSMPPPSSGGVCLAEILNILEGFPMSFVPQGSAESYHLIASAFERAFADRTSWLGDPDFSVIPDDGLISKSYADNLRKEIDRFKRVKVKKSGDPWEFSDKKNTSHLSVIDSEGNMASMTTSVNTSFGSLVYVPEAGFFLNSTMDDFTTNTKEANQYDLIGSEVNAIAPGKRPLSSMSPTLVFDQGEPFLSIGSVGGPKIITSVAQIIINVIDYDMNIQAAIDAPRIHMQWNPDKLYIETEVPVDVLNKLNSMGWTVVQKSLWSLSQGVRFNKSDGEFFGASDARGVGSAGPADDK